CANGFADIVLLGDIARYATDVGGEKLPYRLVDVPIEDITDALDLHLSSCLLVTGGREIHCTRGSYTAQRRGRDEDAKKLAPMRHWKRLFAAENFNARSAHER